MVASRDRDYILSKITVFKKLGRDAEKTKDDLHRLLQMYGDRVVTSAAFKALLSEAGTISESYFMEEQTSQKILKLGLKKGELDKIDLDYPHIAIEGAISNMSQITLQCQKRVALLESKISPLTTLQISELKSLRDELEKHNTLDQTTRKNIIWSIEEYEQGHFLASIMISGRSTCYLIEQIPGKGVAEKNDFLKDHKIIDSSNRGEITTDFINKADKLARNYFSHDISAFPDPSDAVELLGACIKLAKIKNLLDRPIEK